MKEFTKETQVTFFRLILFVLLAVALILPACSGEPATTVITEPPSIEELDAQGFFAPELPRVTCEQLKQMMDSGEPLVVVDTRAKPLFDMEHIPHSINIPYQRVDEIETSLLALPKDRPIVFY